MTPRGATTIWLTGLPCSGKSTLSKLVAEALRERGRVVEVLDGDAVRARFWAELGFSPEHRALNVRRLGLLAELLNRNGVDAVVAAVSPFESGRREVRELLPRFLEVFVSCPLEICEQRDVKGMYARSRRGELPNFTGIDSPYEEPRKPDVVVHTNEEAPAESLAKILARLAALGF